MIPDAKKSAPGTTVPYSIGEKVMRDKEGLKKGATGFRREWKQGQNLSRHRKRISENSFKAHIVILFCALELNLKRNSDIIIQNCLKMRCNHAGNRPYFG